MLIIRKHGSSSLFLFHFLLFTTSSILWLEQHAALGLLFVVCQDDDDCSPNGKCDLDDDKCTPQPCPLACQNGATCILNVDHGLVEYNEYSCQCPSTHRGALCQDPIPFLCEDHVDCFPNGMCGNALECVCNPGYWGERCDKPCPLECQNGGQCGLKNEHGSFQDIVQFYCICPDGFVGSFCQVSTLEEQQEGLLGEQVTGEHNNNGKIPGWSLGIAGALFVFVTVVLVSMRVTAQQKKRNNAPSDGVERTASADYDSQEQQKEDVILPKVV